MAEDRKARYTTDAEDEVELMFIQDCGPGHKDTGSRGVLYYSTTLYRTRQAKHGSEIYPEPTHS